MRFWVNSSRIKVVLMFAVLVLACCSLQTFAQQSFSRQANVNNLSAETLTKILDKYRGRAYQNFNRFALDVYTTGKRLFELEQHNAIGNFVANKRLRPQQSFVVQRLFGVYTRLKYGGEARRMLAKLVSIPTFRKEGVEQHKNINFIRLEKIIAGYAKEFGLKYKNINGRVYEVSLPGKKGGVLVGLHAHGDVVPANPDLWVLEDGTKLDPFKMTQVGNRLYGRGTQDDKNGIVASMIAMRTIKEEKIRLFNDFKLLIDTTEETGSSAIPYYFERRDAPNYNIALDGSYPVMIAEKGSGAVFARFPVRQAKGKGSEIISVSGGQAVNQIPSLSRAQIVSKTPRRLAAILNDLGIGFVAENGGDFEIVAKVERGGVVLDVIGESAHSSDPASGVNPVSRMFLFIKQLRDLKVVSKNHITSAASYLSDNWGLDFYGTKLGINFVHDFMGPLTAAPTLVKLNGETLEVAVNLRIPVGKPIAEIETLLLEQLNQWKSTGASRVTFEFNAKGAMYRNPEGRWLNAMLDIAAENLDLPRKFGSSSGGTSVHYLQNGVQFGLSRPEEKYTGHNANEFKTIDQFLLDLQIVTEMIMRVGLMRNLD